MGSSPKSQVPQADAGGSANRDAQETRTATQRAAGSQVAGRDFAAISPAQAIGRYMVLAQIGRGGMGQVYAAYDPKLDRRVALKLLHTRGDPAQRERLTREAKALARLSHPNVVTVHEVDEHSGRIVLAMEFVDGHTLKQWLLVHPPGTDADRLLKALDILLQAGRGLAAAHDAGLVHRDFKPANVLVGGDGRVRVADFGLARGTHEGCTTRDTVPEGIESCDAAVDARVTRTGVVIGTPAYMAPEQAQGAVLDERTDLFSFCVTGWELLFGRRPFEGASRKKLSKPDGVIVPTVVEAALRRGLSTRPRARQRSMGVLLDELKAAADVLRGQVAPATSSIPWRLVAGALLLVGVGVGGNALNDLRLARACEGRADRIDEIWNDDAQVALEQGVRATGVGYADVSATKVTPWISAQAEAWRDGTRTACTAATITKTWQGSDYDKATWCLEERWLELETLVSELTHADDTTVQRAVQAATGLSRIEGCIDEGALAGMPEAPAMERRDEVARVRAELSQATVMELLGDYDEGLALARSSREQAEEISWAPLTAAARSREASLLERAGQDAEAEQGYVAAYMEAAGVGAWGVAAEAATTLVFVLGKTPERSDEARVWGEHARVAIGYAGDPGRLREAGLLRILDTGDSERDVAAREQSIAIYREGLGWRHPAVAAAVNSLGKVHFDVREYGDAIVLYRKSLSLFESALGPMHPRLVTPLGNLGAAETALADYDAVGTHRRRALKIARSAFPPEHPAVLRALRGIAMLHSGLGEHNKAIELYEEQLANHRRFFGPDHSSVAFILAALGGEYYKIGKLEQARDAHQKALEIRINVLGAEHIDVAFTYNSIGGVERKLGNFDNALAFYNRALAIQRSVFGENSSDASGTLHNLCILYRQMGDVERAQDHGERALKASKKAFGESHPYVAMALTNLAEVSVDAGEYERARDYYQRAISIRSASQSHAGGAYALGRLGALLSLMKDYPGAIKYLELALAVRSGNDSSPKDREHSRFRVAQALWEAPLGRGQDHDRSHRLALQARDALVAMDDDELAGRIDAWLAERTWSEKQPTPTK